MAYILKNDDDDRIQSITCGFLQYTDKVNQLSLISYLTISSYVTIITIIKLA
jgi:hypothetical protein